MLKNRRCSKCGAALHPQQTRCKKCAAAQAKPKKF
jgi:uncharacterized OB-fold protein